MANQCWSQAVRLWTSFSMFLLLWFMSSTVCSVVTDKSHYQNIAVGKPSGQIDTKYDAEASRANDGNPSGNFKHKSCTYTASTIDTWWVVDLLERVHVYAVQMKNRNNEFTESLRNFYVYVSETNPLPLPPTDGEEFKGEVCLFHSGALPASKLQFLPCENNRVLRGRYVYVWKPGSTGQLTICELEVLTRYSLRKFVFSMTEGLKSQVKPYNSERLTGATYLQCNIFCLNLANVTTETMQFDRNTGDCSCFVAKPFEDDHVLKNTTAAPGVNIMERQ